MLRAESVVGRGAERAAIEALLGGAGTGRGGALFVIGEAGIGKSALVRDAMAERPGVLVGRTTPPPAPAYRPLSELALDALGNGARPESADLRLHRAALDLLLRGSGGDAGTAEQPSPLHVGDALLRLAATAGARGLLVEDLHWADADTLAAVEYLADRAPGRGVALVVTLRPGGSAEEAAHRLDDRRSGRILRLPPLDEERVRLLVASCLAAEPPAELLAAMGAAEGSPLLVEELLATYHQRGALRQVPRGWRFRPTAEPTVPARVEATVSERLGRLAEDHRQVLGAAALLGRDVDAGLLARSLPDLDVGAALHEAVAAGLVAPDPAGGRLRFAHALVRDAVLQTSAAPVVAALARQLLAALDPEVTPGTLDPRLAATLARAAGDDERATTLLVHTAREAMAHGLPTEAVRLLDQAIGMLAPGPRSLEAREELLQALALAGDAGRAAQVGRQVRRQLEAAGASPDRQFACVTAMARAATNAGRWAEAAELLRPLVGDSDDPVPAATLAMAARVALELSRLDEAEPLALAVNDDAEAAPSVRCEAAELLGRLARRSDLDVARSWFEREAGLAEVHGLALWQARALHELATIDQLRTVSVAGLEEAREAAVGASAPGLLAAVDFHLAAVHGMRFEPAEALAAARRCLDTARDLGASRQEAWAWVLIAQAHAVAGEAIRARVAADEARRLGGSDDEILGTALTMGYGLPALLGADRAEAAGRWLESVEHLRRLPEPAPLPTWFLWAVLATALDVEGDGGARARAETDVASLRLATGADGLWQLAAAVGAGRAGDRGAAEDAARVAAARLALTPALAGYGHLGWILAAAPAIEDGWGEPGRWLTDAAAWADGRGLAELARSCAALARRAGVSVRRRGRGEAAVPPALAALGVTSREVDVLRLVAQGLTNGQIAERLYLSLRTVKGHVESLLAKTGAANRTHLATRAPAEDEP